MKAIHIANAKRRDAEVAIEQHVRKAKVKTVLADGTDKVNVRLLKSTVDYDLRALLERVDGNWGDLEESLAATDADADMEQVGKLLTRTHRIYVDGNDRIAYRINLYQAVYNPDGSERSRSDVNKLPANIDAAQPIRWTNKRFAKAEVVRRFVFSRKYQLRHINGVTFDFLFNMANELQQSGTMVLVGAGPKGTDPILLTRGGQPYRGFLEGRAGKDRYALILHLADIELKSPLR